MKTANILAAGLYAAGLAQAKVRISESTGAEDPGRTGG